MADKPVVLIHGWSDSSESFEPLARGLAKATERPVQNLWLGDYISLDDDVTLADISNALQRAWTNEALTVDPNSVDVIVHSTGGLVVREWMYAHYTSRNTRPPVQNLVMLAPANFGSPLAHKGRAIIGRVVKGIGSGFETGTHILKALEMASPYSWSLAEKDRFGPNVFSRDGVNCTVIVGNSGYPGISGLANEDGSDGTVYVATAGLNCARVKMTVARSSKWPDGDKEDQIRASGMEFSRGATALLVANNYNHSTITGREKLRKALLEDIVRGLEVTRQTFPAWVTECEERTSAVMERYANRRDSEKHAFQNTVFRVMDDQGAYVDDYVVEFYGNFQDDKDFWARVFNKDISGKTHAYGDNQAYRSFMIDVSRLTREIDQQDERLCISLSALPDVMQKDAVVGYKTTGANHIGRIELSPDEVRAYFRPNRTLLIDIVIPRYQQDDLVRLRKLG